MRTLARTLAEHLAEVSGIKRRPLHYVASGPSAVWSLPAEGVDVACVNEVAARLPFDTVDYLICCDLEGLLLARPAWLKARNILLSDRLHVNSAYSEVQPCWVPHLPLERVILFPLNPICYTEEQTRAAVEQDGGWSHGDWSRLAVCNAACAGLHAMSLLGYKSIRVYGIDGGRGYCEAMDRTAEHQQIDHTPARQRTEYLAGLLRQKYGVSIEFCQRRAL